MAHKLLNDKVSIVMPVYNSEKYLRHSIESVLSQSYSNIELVLVNDGSTDNSEKICDEYVKKDSRVLLISQANQGVSAARNNGIDRAAGEYISFIDADDYYENDAIEVMIGLMRATQADIVRTHWQEIKGNTVKPGREKVKSGFYSKARLRVLQYEVANGGMMGFSVLLLLRKSLLVSKNIRYPQGISMMEDICFCVDVLESAASMYISDKTTYNYVKHEESASRSLQGFVGKIESIVKVNTYVSKKKFSTAQIRSINATHVSIVSNMVMARIDSLFDGKRISRLLAEVHGVSGVESIYKKANMRTLGVYYMLEAWSVMHKSKTAVRGIKLLRLVLGR